MSTSRTVPHYSGIIVVSPEIMGSCLGCHYSGFDILLVCPHPRDLPDQWKQDAAYFYWKNHGAKWQEAGEDRDKDFCAAVEQQCDQTVGRALVYYTCDEVRILGFSISKLFGRETRQRAIRSMLDRAVSITTSRRLGCVICHDTRDPDVREALNERHFSRVGRTMERRL